MSTATTFTAVMSCVVLSFVGCKSDTVVPQTQLPHVTTEMNPAFPAGSDIATAYANTPIGEATVGERFANFCLAITAQGGGATSVGFLPIVTYDARKNGPWVSELGMRIADDLAHRLKQAGYTGTVLDLPELDVRIQNSGLQKASFSTLDAVAAGGPKLGLDVITFGTLKRENNLGLNGRDLLTLDLNALQVATGRVLARETFEVRSDKKDNEAFFQLSERDSLWLPDSR